MFVGVGGQGTLLASKLFGYVLLAKGYDVKVSEVHGMSQRGGDVVTYVRYGEKVYSPLVSVGKADVIVAFELLEGLRYLQFLSKSGTMIVNDMQIEPMPVITGAEKYPEDIVATISSQGADVIHLDAFTLAEQAGSSRSVNVVLIGVMAKKLGFDKEIWMEAIDDSVKEQFREMNKKAFLSGYNLL